MSTSGANNWIYRICLLIAMVTTCIPSGAHAAQAGVWQYWKYPTLASGYTTADQLITVTTTQPTRFFSHQFFLTGKGVAYIGIQDTTHGKVAIFSLWNSPGNFTTGSLGSYCVKFGGEGVGYSCRSAYQWKVGNTYRVRMQQTQTKPGGSVKYMGSVQDTNTGIETVLGYLWTPAGQASISSSVSWIEDYGHLKGNCSNEDAAEATFSLPSLNDGIKTATLGSSRTSTCGNHSSTIMRLSNGARLIE